jgi:hypothetical protein
MRSIITSCWLSIRLPLACGALGLCLLMCGSDEGGGADGSSGGPDGGGTSTSGGSSGGASSSGGSSGETDSGPTAGPKRPTFSSAKVLPQVYRVVPLAAGWAVLTQQVTQATVIDGVTLQTGGPVLLKLDAAGVVQWAKTLDTGGGSQNGPPRLSADEAGNLYVAGLTYAFTVDFGDGITKGTGNSTCDVTQVAFVGQVDANGTAKWLRIVYCPQGVGDIQVAARNGKVAVAGDYSPYFALSYETSGGTVIAPLHTRESDRPSYVLSLGAADGFATWAKLFGTERTAAEIGGAGIDSVAIDAAGEITASGTYTVGPLLDTANAPIATPVTAGYVVKLTADGTTKWVRPFANAGLEGMVADATRVVAAGSMKVDVDFGMGVRKGPAFFTVALDPATGATTADKTFGGGGTDLFAIGHDEAGGTALGFVVPAATAGGVVDNITLPTDHSTFIVKLAPDLEARWIESFARPEAASVPVFPTALAVDGTGKTAFGGVLNAAHDFGGGSIAAPNGFVVWYMP